VVGVDTGRGAGEVETGRGAGEVETGRGAGEVEVRVVAGGAGDALIDVVTITDVVAFPIGLVGGGEGGKFMLIVTP
jgi:hypothetical protein